MKTNLVSNLTRDRNYHKCQKIELVDFSDAFEFKRHDLFIMCIQKQNDNAFLCNIT